MFLLPSSNDGSVTPSPPSEIHPVSFPLNAHCSRILSLSPYCLLSVRLLFSQPSTSSSTGCHPLSARRKSSSLKLTSSQCHAAPGVLYSLLMYEGCPRLTCAAVSTWFGCGRRGVGDGAPLDDIEVLDALTGVASPKNKKKNTTLFSPCR